MANDGAIVPLIGRPGVSAGRTANYGIVFRNTHGKLLFPGGAIVDGTKSRDPENTNILVMRPGLMLGRTSGNKLANSMIGVSQTAITGASSTSVTLTVPSATELVRWMGTSGTFTITGPASANGTMHNETVTYSAVNLTTGVVTISTTTNSYVAGSFIGDTDGSQTPITFVDDGYGLRLPDVAADIDMPKVPIAGNLYSTGLIYWPTDTSLQNWVVTNLSTVGGGKFVFDHLLVTQSD